MSPQAFRKGDLVEVELSLIAVPVANGMRKMKVILRAIVLIDDSFAKVSSHSL